MYGDRPGSPRRDDRQSPQPEPQSPFQAAPYQTPQQSPHEHDVRVAGAAARPGEAFGEPGGDTATLPASDEIEVGPGMPQGPASRSRKPAKARRPAKAARASKEPKAAGGRTGLKVAAVAAGALVVVGGGAVAAFAFTGGGDGDKTVVQPSASPLADAPKQPVVDVKALAAARHKEALDRASRSARRETAKRPALLPKGTPIPTKKPDEEDGGGSGGEPPTAGNPMPAGEAQAYAKSIMGSYGFSPSTHFGCLVNLWNKESNWNYRAQNPTSGAYGIPQALPGTKMASEGADWRTNAKTQIRWGLGYIKSRHGTPCGAWQHSQSKGWY